MSTRRPRSHAPPIARLKEAPRAQLPSAGIEVLPARFVKLSPVDTECAIEALAALLAPIIARNDMAGEPDATIE